MSLRTLALSLLLFTACTDTESDPTITLDESSISNTAQVVEDYSNLCDLLPPDDGGACSHLCDPEGLDSFFPAGQCTLILCHLTDGTIYRTGACVP